MPAAKLCTSGTLDAMKPEEGNDSLDTFIGQAIVKDPILPFTRTAESHVQWVQLLHALDQPDLPGWPFLTPVKAQMQKCEKCSREFCSSINYRRHIRVHRKSLNVNKEIHKNRDLLAAFWDKMSLEQANKIVSFDDVMLKEIPGSFLIRALASSLQKTGMLTLPPIHVRAGNTLLDIIQANPSRAPISSHELFSTLDEASERTFLCAGTAESVQKYVFDGETAKNCLELKNIIACASFFFELQLVKVWIADKDAEALRCHKLLVEEEEAAQKRQALLLEKKRQKKLRKEQKVKEQFNRSSENIDVNVDAVDGPISAEASGPSSPSDSYSDPPDMLTNIDLSLESTQSETKESNEEDIKQGGDSQTTKPHMMGPPNGNRHLAANRWQAPKSQRGGRFGFSPQPLKSEPIHKPSLSKDRSLQNGTKIWAKKLKIDIDGENLKLPSPQGETSRHIEEDNCEVIIGSIPVTLRSSVSQQNKATDISSNEHTVIPKKNASEKLTKANNRVVSKHWRPVRHDETKSVLPLDRGNENIEGAGAISGMVPDQIVSSDERSEQSQSADGDLDNQKKQYSVLLTENAQRGRLPFSSAAAKEFLNQRWKEAMSSDHVTLVLSEAKPPGSSDVQHESSAIPNASDPPVNQMDRNIQVKISKKPEKGVKIKYIPKQK
ncbi:hypothetical protein CASFOL_023607 [Castilleja foliolosa]|uniref:C2H2-type domain-containing protein n=1 Tax=Castilleja foliolosa TaxID=1961234 RepID=A0ABD3CL07_9LAMI